MSIAEGLRTIAHYNKPVRFDVRRRSIVALDVDTRSIVAQFPLRRGVDGHTVLPKIIALLLDSGECEIHQVDGADENVPLTLPEGADW